MADHLRIVIENGSTVTGEFDTVLAAAVALLEQLSPRELNWLHVDGIHRVQLRQLRLAAAGPVGSNIVREKPHVTEILG